ncbi:MaoC/PaaZ C-terminal domain-containing protein [Sphingopyxis sp. LARHCG72]
MQGQGSLTFSIMTGLILWGPSTQANYGVDRLRFLHPVFIGDTVCASAELRAHRQARPAAKP